MNSFSVHCEPETIEEFKDLSPFNYKKDIKDIPREELYAIAEEIGHELIYGIHRPPNLVRRYLSKFHDAAWVKIKTVDLRRDAGKSNGYRCIVLLDLKNYHAYLLHIYRHGHGEDKNISEKDENKLKNLVEEYSKELNNCQ